MYNYYYFACLGSTTSRPRWGRCSFYCRAERDHGKFFMPCYLNITIELYVLSTGFPGKTVLEMGTDSPASTMNLEQVPPPQRYRRR